MLFPKLGYEVVGADRGGVVDQKAEAVLFCVRHSAALFVAHQTVAVRR